MRYWNNLSIVSKTVMLFSILLLLTATLGCVSLKQMRALNKMSEDIHRIWLPNVRDTGVMKTCSTRFRGLEFLHVLSDSDAEKKELEAKMKENFVTYAQAKERIRKRVDTEELREIYVSIEKTEEAYVRQAHIKAMELSYQGKKKEAVDLLIIQALPIKNETDKVMEQLIDYCNDNSELTISQTQDLYAYSRSMIILNIAFALIAGVACLVVIAVSIKKRLSALIYGVNKIADGDLGHRIDMNTSDEMGAVATVVNSMAASLHTMVGLIKDISADLSAFSNKMYSSVDSLLSSFETVDMQATSVAGASEELAANSEQVSVNCMASAEEASVAKDYTNEGFSSVETTIDLFTDISDHVHESKDMVVHLGERSGDIGAIIDTIKDIAEQTNMLALNAAIEAARAGDHGRGFAVVADEVRTLAERTASATSDIGEMIQSIQKVITNTVEHMNSSTGQLGDGVQSVNDSGEKLKLILDKVDSVNTQICQIAEAASQQSDVTKDISHSITEISTVVKDRKEALHDMMEDIRELTDKTVKLNEIIKKFSV
jgi:methyl-accepting chemotaxis protein